MSIAYTADVFCDGVRANGEPCPDWTNGVTGATPPTKKLARDRAANEFWVHVHGKDYCPACAMSRGLAAKERNEGEKVSEQTVEIFVVVATIDHEGSDPIRAFGIESDAAEFTQRCRDYDGTYRWYPPMEASDNEWQKWNASNDAWKAAHPAAPRSRRDSYDVVTVPFLPGSKARKWA
jgi:hypothetical protein